MNILFSLVFILSNCILLFFDPDAFLSTLLDGASTSATLCISLVASYCVWLGLMEVWTRSGVSSAFSKLLAPLAKRLFKTEDKETLDAVCMNLSVNLLGVAGAGTAYGIRSANLLDKSENAEYASSMLFVLNATSLQLIPTSIVGIRSTLGSSAPADIILPTLIATAFSTILGAMLVRIFIPPKKQVLKNRYFIKKQGAGI